MNTVDFGEGNPFITGGLLMSAGWMESSSITRARLGSGACVSVPLIITQSPVAYSKGGELEELLFGPLCEPLLLLSEFCDLLANASGFGEVAVCIRAGFRPASVAVTLGIRFAVTGTAPAAVSLSEVRAPGLNSARDPVPECVVRCLGPGLVARNSLVPPSFDFTACSMQNSSQATVGL